MSRIKRKFLKKNSIFKRWFYKDYVWHSRDEVFLKIWLTVIPDFNLSDISDHQICLWIFFCRSLKIFSWKLYTINCFWIFNSPPFGIFSNFEFPGQTHTNNLLNPLLITHCYELVIYLNESGWIYLYCSFLHNFFHINLIVKFKCLGLSIFRHSYGSSVWKNTILKNVMNILKKILSSFWLLFN